MNKLTRKIRNKGYSLLEFCAVYDIALRTYRAREKESHVKHQLLIEQIDSLAFNFPEKLNHKGNQYQLESKK